MIGLAALPLIAVLGLYLVMAKDAPNGPALKSLAEYASVLRRSATPGGSCSSTASPSAASSGLASSLTIYFNDVYGLSPVVAGYFTAACVFAGSLVRPIGGALADRIGGVRSLTFIYAVAAVALGIVSLGLPNAWLALAVFVLAMLALGMGNGAVFQLVPQRFRAEIGVMTGLVGMTGGVGGFYLASTPRPVEAVHGSPTRPASWSSPRSPPSPWSASPR